MSSAIDGLGWPRRASAVGLGALVFALGVPAALDIEVLDWMDKLAGSVFLVFGGLMMALFVGWRMRPELLRFQLDRESGVFFSLWYFLLRYIVPPAIVLVYVWSVAFA